MFRDSDLDNLSSTLIFFFLIVIYKPQHWNDCGHDRVQVSSSAPNASEFQKRKMNKWKLTQLRPSKGMHFPLNDQHGHQHLFLLTHVHEDQMPDCDSNKDRCK